MLRSDAWIVGDDEAALEHRAALRAAGLEVDPGGGRPVIGIANSASEFNPCNLPLRDLLPAVRDGVRAAGGIPVEFPVISLGEDLMMPTAMLYRNLLAMEIEEMTRSHPVDGLILLANCDKTVPGALMGAASTNLPTLVITGGARPPARFRGRRLGTGTDLWRPPASPHRRGLPALYRAHVTQAPKGCDLDFLEAPTPADRVFVEPVVGRS